jgi:hypothetical protein
MAVEAAGVGIGALVAQDIDEDAIPAFAMEALYGLAEDMFIVHAFVPLIRPL